MAGMAAEGGVPGTIRNRPDVRQARVANRGAHSPIADIRSRCRTEQQADACERLIRYLSRCERREGRRIDRTWRQLAAGLGKPVDGLSQRRARELYRGAIRRTIDYLIGWGYIESYETLYEPNGEGRCIVLTLPAGVAQSVQAAVYGRTDVRTATARRRASFTPEVCTPRGGTIGGQDSHRLREHRGETERARARCSSRASAASQLAARAALAGLILLGAFEEGGAGAVRARPALAELPIEQVAREAWRLFAGAEELSDLGDGRLSPAGRRRLERASSQLARVGYGGLTGPAAPAAAVIDIALGDWRLYWPGRGTAGAAMMRAADRPPATLGGLVTCLHRLAHQERAGWRWRQAASR